MKITLHKRNDGIALIIVMMVILVLGALAGKFAYSMKVETTLARNANNGSEMEWLGRSGVELGRYVLGIHMTIPNEGTYDSLCQKWAGGPLGTNEALANISLENVELGRGRFSIKIIDLERKLNINLADQVILQRGLDVLTVDYSEQGKIVDSILDWRDTDDYTLLNGTESEYYETLDPPYYAKNGPLDDLSELLLIRYITPEMYLGGASTNMAIPMPRGPLAQQRAAEEFPTYPYGLRDLFTVIGQRTININTAPPEVLRLIPGIDETIAASVITTRAGYDGVDGTEDDLPFRNSADLGRVPGFAMLAQDATFSQFFNVRSATFEIHVTAEVGGTTSEWIGIVVRRNQQDIRVISFYQK